MAGSRKFLRLINEKKYDEALSIALKDFSMVEYRHAVKVSDIACRCAKEVGYRANLCLAGGFYYRMGRWIGEPYIKNAVNKAESLCFPAELISILAEYYGEEQLPS